MQIPDSHIPIKGLEQCGHRAIRDTNRVQFSDYSFTSSVCCLPAFFSKFLAANRHLYVRTNFVVYLIVLQES